MPQKISTMSLLAIILISTSSLVLYFNYGSKDSNDVSLEDFGPSADFTLTNINNDSVTFSDYNGKVRVVTFIYTKCTQGCGTITVRLLNALTQLNEKGLQDDVTFFEIDFDYVHDNLSIFREYAEIMVGDGQIPSNFEFVTGSETEINKTAEDWGFYMELSKSPTFMNTSMDMNTTMTNTAMTDTTTNSTHSGHEVVWIHPFVVFFIDQNGIVRKKLWGLDWSQNDVLDIVNAMLD